MKQEMRAFLDTAASRRAAHLRKQDPEVQASYVLDDLMPRAVVKAEKQGKIVAFEFLETAETAAVHANMEDYVFAANEFGTLAVCLPESNYAREVASTVLSDLYGRIKQSGATGDFKFAGYTYDAMGNFRKIR
ncbi:MAG: hypothetical protein ACM3L5_00210 [Candidatus Saccharibacteria bacterium]